MALTQRRGSTRALSSIAAATLALAALAGCGGGSDDSADGGSGAGGDPILVYTVGPFTSQATAAFDELRAAAEATVASINDDGGVNGREIELRTCDDQLTPTVAQTCYQTAIDDGAVAVIGGYNVFGSAIVDLVDAAGMPMVGTAGGLDLVTGDNWFPLTTATINAYNVAGSQAVERGAKNVAMLVSNTPGGVPLSEAAAQGAKDAGGTMADPVQLAASEANTGPAVETLLASNPDAVIFAVSALQTQSALEQLSRSGYTGEAYVQTTLSTAVNIEQLSKYPNIAGFQAMPPFTDTSVDGIKQFRDVMAEYQPDSPMNELAVNTFLAYKVFAQVAATIDGDITRESLTDAFSNTSTLDTMGLTADIPDWFTGEAPDPDHPRLFTNYALMVDIKPDQLVWDGTWLPGLGGGEVQTAG
jgi:ABC-type branched-subunit amino acid transport system substrate-binding protein